MTTRRQLLLSLAGLACASTLGGGAQAAVQLSAKNAQFLGVWLAPDWFLPGVRKYDEAAVRSSARRVLRGLSEAGVNAVFLETFLRGYCLAPGVVGGRYKVRPLPYIPGRQGLPPYPHLEWKFRVEVDCVVDPLEVFIQEGRSLGIDIHAWTHLFYWKMDNPSAMLPWHNSPSLWSQMMVEYLRSQAPKVSVKATADLMLAAADLLTSTTDGRTLARLLASHGTDPKRGPLGALVSLALRDGAAHPDFLVIHSADEPFPASRGKQLRPIYLNPANPQVQEKLLFLMGSLVKAHPDLAGIHLDHVRYPVDGQGLPEELQVKDGAYNFYNPADNAEMARYRACKQQLQHRVEVLRLLIDKIRAQVPTPKQLSAAVLPSYYYERDNGRYRLGGYDFSCQDWVSWKVDFVVPMLYEMSPSFVRSLLELANLEQEKRLGGPRIGVIPGVSNIQWQSTGELSSAGRVFFDLKQARDVRLERKEQTEDMNFGPQ